jgi:hypothetical protein
MRGCWVHDVLIAHFIGSSVPMLGGKAIATILAGAMG